MTFLLCTKIFLPLLNLIFAVTQLLEQFETGFVGRKASLLKHDIEVCGSLNFSLKVINPLAKPLVLSLQLSNFLCLRVNMSLLLISH